MAVTDHLAAFAFMLGIIFSFAHSRIKRLVLISTALGILGGCIVFGIRLYDPRGMNLILIAFNRRLVITIAALALLAVLLMILYAVVNLAVPEREGGPLAVEGLASKQGGQREGVSLIFIFELGILILVSLIYLVPPVLQYTREFVYFGESGISTNALLRALGFTLGILACLLLTLSAYEVHRALRNDREKKIFLFSSLLIYALEFSAAAVAAMQRLKILKTSDAIFNITVFDIMIWRGANPNAFIFAQLILGLVMLIFVIRTHLKPAGEFANKALLRKEKARLRDCRRWSWSLFTAGAIVMFVVIVLHYYDTKPPAEVQPEPYEISNGIISIELAQVSDGHLHKFSYVTPNKYDVRFLIVKKPAGTAYGVGLDACEICGIAGYYERGDEVVCRRCDVVMNKNTIGFKGGCNPIPFEYEVRAGKIFIDTKELEQHEKRFK